MSKSYGPKGFEKAWIKALKGFNETKILFTHTKSDTTIKYIHNNKLLGVEMYRSQYEIDRWIGHFQAYLDTGTFDTDAYWVQYTHDTNNKKQIITNPVPLPMELRKQIWSVHSKEMSNYLRKERAATKLDIGFEQVARP